MTPRVPLALASVALLAATSACDPPVEPTIEPGLVDPGDEYVALGDSYTAAPGIGPAVRADGCFNSPNNYPNLVADATGVELLDNSCSGATTESLTGPQTTILGRELPPQLDEVGSDTDLVTVRIGGNDWGLYSVMSQICPRLTAEEPDGSPCTDAAEEVGGKTIEAKLDDLKGRITRVVRAIVRRAPDAEVLVVGYPAFAPEDGPCEVLPIAPGDIPLAVRINRGLNEAMRTAAERVGVRYVDVYAVTKGHDICSDEPWIAGQEARNGRAAPWHPYIQEQEATADAILAALDEA